MCKSYRLSWLFIQFAKYKKMALPFYSIRLKLLRTPNKYISISPSDIQVIRGIAVGFAICLRVNYAAYHFNLLWSDVNQLEKFKRIKTTPIFVTYESE